jgi:achilleol B synthase
VYDGTQTWDTAFIVKAYYSTDLIHEFAPTLQKAHGFIKCLQVSVSNLYYIVIYGKIQ